jgi:hypothetical protein
MEGNNSCIMYDKLNPFAQDQNFLKLIRDISTGVIEIFEPVSQISLITDLRRLRKFHKDLFITVFDNITSQFIDNMVYNNFSQVTFHSIVLITEIFGEYDEQIKSYWIKDLLQATLQHTTHKDIHVKDQCQFALHNLSSNMLFEETLYTLFISLDDSDDTVCLNAFETMRSFIYYCPPVHFANHFNWEDTFEFVLDSLEKNENKRLIEYLKIIFCAIEDKLESDFQDFLSEKLNAQKINVINALIKRN